MAYKAELRFLQLLVRALQKPVKERESRVARRMMARVLVDGWIHRADIEDLLMALDYRLDSHGAGDTYTWANLLKLPWYSVSYRPKARANYVMGFDSLSASDLAQLLIQLERLGFTTDPQPLVEGLLPVIRMKPLITSAELDVLWFERRRRKGLAAVTVVESERHRLRADRKTWVMSTGYKAEVWGDREGNPIELEVRGPKFRTQREPVETVCADCGHSFMRGDPDSSAAHRKEHKERLYYLHPQPHPAMLDARATEAEPELVTSKSAKWKHREIYLRARAFRREFHYDFVQWQSPKGDNDPTVQGFLFTDGEGAIVGACAFRLQNSEGAAPRWGLQWIWICPAQRRRGHLASRWAFFRQRFGDFEIEGPVSDAMRAFALKRGDGHLL